MIKKNENYYSKSFEKKNIIIELMDGNLLVGQFGCY